ncbi:MAG: hypothetical protein CO035_01500 [Candidatus Omnitrophica bacterium CG_4_9_14_0_2_um_filter_42_8]|nr:MAG: hypothetical protein CO035_01500 [Candidatus Omnitrophica bacterium CG_4_9_14_0_2_um_filter_42_8]
MPKKIILKVGDAIEYSGRRGVVIEKIRIISTGELVKEYRYNKDGYDVVLTLKDKQWVFDLWVKDTAIHILEKKEPGK